jgi:hypothetical protein
VSVTALVLATFSPVVAIVRFEPTPEPVRERWVAEVEVAVPWAQVSLRVPAEWKVKVKREPTLGISGGAALLAAFGPGGTVCVLDIYDPQTIETWQDAGVQPARDLTIAGHPAERFDDMIGAGAATASAYSIYAPEWIYSLFCTADRAPTDRWLSVIETLELPPERMP